MVKCVGARNTEPDKVAEAHSSKFNLDRAGLTSSAASYRSKNAIDSDVAMLLSPKFSPCYEEQMQKGLEARGLTVESVSAEITLGSAGGPANVVATGTTTIKAVSNGQPVALYMRVAYITGPLVTASVTGTNLGLPIAS